MSDLKFQKLTPTRDVNLNAYEEGFEFIFNNSDIRNIAISGPYSSGKSSLLESYKEKQDTNKVVLLCEIIKKFECDSIKEVLIVAGYEEVSKLLDSKIRPRILANRKHEQLLEALKEKQFITSYELNEKSGIYNYTRSSKKRNNFPTELL